MSMIIVVFTLDKYHVYQHTTLGTGSISELILAIVILYLASPGLFEGNDYSKAQ